MKEMVVLGLGSNTTFGEMNSIELLHKACEEISLLLCDMQQSSIYQTKPMYVEEQEDFFNMVVSGSYEGEAESLLNSIHEIEAKLGRNREKEIRFGQRSIDIDIELFGDKNVQSQNLEIPHPRLYERAFVLVPLAELLCSGKVVLENEEKLFSALDSVDTSGVKIYNG